jgi:hypothetical protein
MLLTHIIAVTGQSNSQGAYGIYDKDIDEVDDRIFGWNDTSNLWEIASLETESMGKFWHRPQYFSIFAFHMAKEILKTDEDAKIGIINFGVGGFPVARWVMLDEKHEYYELNKLRAEKSLDVTELWDVKQEQGDAYKHHVGLIQKALSQTNKTKIDCVCWQHGEADYDMTDDYYKEMLLQTIIQYRNESFANDQTIFLAGVVPGSSEQYENYKINYQNKNEIIREFVLSIGFGGLIETSDLPTGDDGAHLTTEGHRELGSRYAKVFVEFVYKN